MSFRRSSPSLDSDLDERRAPVRRRLDVAPPFQALVQEPATQQGAADATTRWLANSRRSPPSPTERPPADRYHRVQAPGQTLQQWFAGVASAVPYDQLRASLQARFTVPLQVSAPRGVFSRLPRPVGHTPAIRHAVQPRGPLAQRPPSVVHLHAPSAPVQLRQPLSPRLLSHDIPPYASCYVTLETVFVTSFRMPAATAPAEAAWLWFPTPLPFCYHVCITAPGFYELQITAVDALDARTYLQFCTIDVATATSAPRLEQAMDSFLPTDAMAAVHTARCLQSWLPTVRVLLRTLIPVFETRIAALHEAYGHRPRGCRCSFHISALSAYRQYLNALDQERFDRIDRALGVYWTTSSSPSGSSSASQRSTRRARPATRWSRGSSDGSSHVDRPVGPVEVSPRGAFPVGRGSDASSPPPYDGGWSTDEDVGVSAFGSPDSVLIPTRDTDLR